MKKLVIKKDIIFALLLLLLCSNNIVIEISSIRITLFMICLALSFFYSKFNKSINVIDFIVLLFISMALASVNSLYSTQYIKMLLYLLIDVYLFFIAKYLIKKNKILNWYNIFNWSGIALGISSIIYYLYGLTSINFYFGMEQTYAGVMVDRNIPRLIGIVDSDPNYACIYFSLFFFFSFTNHLKINYKLMSLMLICIFLTFSRGGWLSIGIAILIYFLKKISQIKKLIKVFLLVIFYLTIFISLNIVMPNNFLIKRIENASASGGSGRLGIWNKYIMLLNDNLFGYGLNSSRPIIRKKFSIGLKPHNTYITILVELGIVTFFIYIFLIMFALFYSFKNEFIFLFIITYASATMFLSVIEMPLFYVILASINSIQNYSKTYFLEKDYI